MQLPNIEIFMEQPSQTIPRFQSITVLPLTEWKYKVFNLQYTYLSITNMIDLHFLGQHL